MQLGDAVQAVDAIRTLTRGTRLPLVFDARDVGWLQIKARERVHRHAAELFTCAGVIVRPTAERVMSGALLGAVRVEIPVEFFTTEPEAREFATAALSESA